MSSVEAVLNTFSDRELEILRLLDQGLSDREIADKLILALSTVKWHNQQIYSKLNVSKRALAISRAKQLGLLNGNLASPMPARPYPVYKLPAQPTRFIGRKREVAEVKRLLQTTRLLTLTGSPGTGKTRLGVQVASEALLEFEDGVYYVALAPLTDASLLVNAIASILGLEDLSSQPLIENLKTTLRDKHLLLLLDNFEHMMSSAALLSELLASAPDIKMLVTSREVLHLYGEQEYFVPPMLLPDPETHTDFSQYEAVELFVQQARAVRPDFHLTDENALDVAKICIRLDGLPLAIELVAARVKLFSPQELLQRMGSVLATFSSSRRDIAARHQTLGRTLDWSYDLLGDAEKILFAHLGVFVSGWTLEAAEYVCGGQPDMDVLEGLASLVDKSLVRQEMGDQGTTRFVMLRIIHEYAEEKLTERGDEEILRQRHAKYYIQFARRMLTFQDVKLVDALNNLETEHNNFRAVLKWSLAGNPEPGLEIIHALGTCWRIRGHLIEGYQWAQQLLEKGKDADPVVRSKALSTTSGLLACILGNYEAAEQMAVEALDLAHKSGDQLAYAKACFAVGNARAAFNVEDARHHLEEALQRFRTINDTWDLARTLNSLGEVARVQDDYGQAEAFYEEALSGFRAIGNPWGENVALHNLAHVAYHQGKLDDAQSLFAEVLTVALELNDKVSIADTLGGLAGVMSVLGQPIRAARLLGASEMLREVIDAHIQPGDRPAYDHTVAVTQSQLDTATFQSAWAEGRLMPLHDAIALALHEPSPN